MAEDDYDLVPHTELHKLEDELSQLRRGTGGANPSNLKDSMDDLSRSLQSMITVFKEAKDELRIEDEEKELMSKKIDPILQKLDNLLDQNEKIAEGILTLADMIKKMEDKLMMHVQKDDSSPFVSSGLGQLGQMPTQQMPSFAPQGQQNFPFARPAQQFPRPQFQQQAFPQPMQVQQQPQQQLQQQSQFNQPPAFPQQAKPSPAPMGDEKDLFSDMGSQEPLFKADAPGPMPNAEPKLGGIGMPPPPPPAVKKKGFFGK